jgi:soluble lytic murein transglycosylase-like protein
MSIESVFENIGSIYQRIDAIKRRFGATSGYSFEHILQSTLEEESNPAGIDETSEPAEQTTASVTGPETGVYNGTIEAAAERFSIPAALIKAVIKQESNYDTRAVSHKGAMGLMQLMPGTARSLGVEDPFDPEENIFGGTRYLVDLINLYEGNLNKALAAYNAGPQRVTTRVPNIPETRGFVDAVLHFYEDYSKTTDEEGF